MVLSPVVEDVCRRYRQALEAAFPGRVIAVKVFGSAARAEAHEDSDVDVLVVLEGLESSQRSGAIDLAIPIGLERDVVVSPLVLSRGEWEGLVQRERLLVDEIARDGVDA